MFALKGEVLNLLFEYIKVTIFTGIIKESFLMARPLLGN